VNAAGYVRVSTDGQVESGQSLDLQRDTLRNFCKQNPKYNLIKIFEDPGISGKEIENRPGLLSLLEEAKKGSFQIVLVNKIDRIARDSFFVLYVEKELKKHKVELYSLSEPYRWDDPTQRIFLQLISSFAEFERTRITERMFSGRMQKISNGRYAGGEPPLGYKSKNGELVIDEKEAEIIKKIFHLRFGRKGVDAIANILNAEGIPSKRNRKFWGKTIYYILKNPVYKGFIRYGKTVKGVHKRIEIFRTTPAIK
jgi:site-specific DNA recombinase